MGAEGFFSSTLLLDYFYLGPPVQRFKNIRACLADLKCKFPLIYGSMVELMTNIIRRFVAVGEISLPDIQHALRIGSRQAPETLNVRSRKEVGCAKSQAPC